jgi:hypothetical protein
VAIEAAGKITAAGTVTSSQTRGYGVFFGRELSRSILTQGRQPTKEPGEGDPPDRFGRRRLDDQSVVPAPVGRNVIGIPAHI